MLEHHIQEKISTWLQQTDQSTKNQLQKLIDDKQENELKEAFFQDLEFGTGGLRGIMGVGTNRMNKYTVGLATQGLANYLLQTFKNQEISVAISYDSRNQSRYFAQIVADVFSANGIRVYIFSHLRPTPQLSFAIRHFSCQSGVMLTASHNPKEYNGYKAYWNDGAQLIAPHDDNVIREVQKVRLQDILFEANTTLIHYIDESFDEIYLEKVQALSLHKNLSQNKNLKLVYSSLHGTGITLVPKVLKKFGFEQVYLVEEQAEPNGDFPTVIFPNPEEAEALTLALQKAKEIDADLVLANDPDADRVGIAIKNLENEFILLNGNQTGALLMYYLLISWQKNKTFIGNEYIVKTIVTTDLIDKIAESFGVNCYNTYTGFKYIASVMRERESKETYVAGCEESYGYLVGDFVRDKDGISACALIAEMTAYAQAYFGSLYQMLLHLYEKFGYYQDFLISITKKGISGMEEIQNMMKNFRENPPKTLTGSKVICIKDYKILQEFDVERNYSQQIPFNESSNVLQFFLEDGSKISVRPSGTEPKIKFYINLKTDYQKDTKEIDAALLQKVQAIKRDLGLA